MPVNENQYEMIRKLELPFEYFREIQDYCSKQGIVFISTPDGPESLQYLLTLDVPLIKIGSTEVTNPEFLKEIGRTGKPVMLSTGMSTLGEVESAINTIYGTGNNNVRLMHCTTDYPTRYEEVNLMAMVTLKNAFHIPVGLSDHTLGCEAAVAAVALGAEFIEKHITLDRDMEGPDHKASMPPDEFREYVRMIRNTEKLLGDGIKSPTARELDIMQNVRRSIVAAGDIKEGTLLTRELIGFKRPGSGIKPEYADLITGRRVKRNLVKDELIKWEDI